MRPEKNEARPKSTTVKVDWELEKKIVDTIHTMEKHAKIPVAELVSTALKRFIAGHKDYLPDNYKA